MGGSLLEVGARAYVPTVIASRGPGGQARQVKIEYKFTKQNSKYITFTYHIVQPKSYAYM